MARPRRNTVDYFPHTCHHGKTMYVLEEAYGNDGYAFWFKLLEMLGASPGHYINCNGFGDWDVLVKKSGVEEGRAHAIMATLSRLQAIDMQLWEARHVVWVQNLTDNLEDAYKKRKSETPERPAWLLEEPVSDPETKESAGIRDPKPPEEGVSASKVKKRKGNTVKEIGSLSIIWEAWRKAKIRDADLVLTSSGADAIKKISTLYPEEKVVKAIQTYSEILYSEKTILKTRWKIAKFLNEWIGTFFPGSKPWEHYAKRGAEMSKEERVAKMLRKTDG